VGVGGEPSVSCMRENGSGYDCVWRSTWMRRNTGPLESKSRRSEPEQRLATEYGVIDQVLEPLNEGFARVPSQAQRRQHLPRTATGQTRGVAASFAASYRTGSRTNSAKP